MLAWARLSRREESWKSAEILLLRHQLNLETCRCRKPHLRDAACVYLLMTPLTLL